MTRDGADGTPEGGETETGAASGSPKAAEDTIDPTQADDSTAPDEPTDPSTADLQALVDDLLVQDVARHERALAELARVGDERVLPHLVHAATLDAVARDWAQFGFPEVYRDRSPPAAFDHPECEFPGVIDALCAIGEPSYDDPNVAWLQWESWLTQHDPDPLPGYVDWMVRFYRTYHPTVGHLLDAEPRHPDFDLVRWGSTDPTRLHPLNFPDWTEASASSTPEHVEPDDLVFGFHVDGDAYAVPRYILFPHELANLEVGGEPLALSYCTMCNSPVCYDRTVDGDEPARPRQFGSTGCLWNGNKLMYDEETLTLWNQQTGTPVAGPGYARDRYGESDGKADGRTDSGAVSLAFRSVTQTTWREWHADNPETAVVARDTGYGIDYEYYRDYDGFIKRHYWENDDVFHPGVRLEDSVLDDRTYVYGVDAPDGLHAFPVEVVREDWPVTASIDGQAVVALPLDGDVAVYDAPTQPIEREDADGSDSIRDADGTRWTPTHDALVPEDTGSVGEPSSDVLDRWAGRHGLWLAFRPHYDAVTVEGGE